MLIKGLWFKIVEMFKNSKNNNKRVIVRVNIYDGGIMTESTLKGFVTPPKIWSNDVNDIIDPDKPIYNMIIKALKDFGYKNIADNCVLIVERKKDTHTNNYLLDKVEESDYLYNATNTKCSVND